MENRGFFSKMAENKITSETFQKLLNFCSSHHNIYDAYLINIYKLTKFHVLTSFLVNRGGGNCQKKNTQKHDFYNKCLKLSIIFLTNTSIYRSKLLLHMFLFIVYWFAKFNVSSGSGFGFMVKIIIERVGQFGKVPNFENV